MDAAQPGPPSAEQLELLPDTLPRTGQRTSDQAVAGPIGKHDVAVAQADAASLAAAGETAACPAIISGSDQGAAAARAGDAGSGSSGSGDSLMKQGDAALAGRSAQHTAAAHAHQPPPPQLQAGAEAPQAQTGQAPDHSGSEGAEAKAVVNRAIEVRHTMEPVAAWVEDKLSEDDRPHFSFFSEGAAATDTASGLGKDAERVVTSTDASKKQQQA